MDAIEQPAPETPPIFIISGGAGALGKHVARIALSQFAGINPQIIVIPQIFSPDQLAEAIAQVAERRGIIIHTMVDPKIRQALVQLAQEHEITAIDTIGDPLAALGRVLGQMPLGQPGLYHGEHET
jgi:regulator of PEP synthase PpsR (kinase-PPPase family)